MFKKQDKNQVRQIRHARVRTKVSGIPERPRLNVYRSNKNIYAQIIDDVNGVTLCAASTLDAELKDKVSEAAKTGAAELVGEAVARKALEKGITEVVFDRGGYLYHGRVAALAEGARKAGLNF